MTLELVGWVATAVSASSYLLKEPRALRRVQAGAAIIWATYGISIGAWPIVAANVIVAAAAGVTSMRGGTDGGGGTDGRSLPSVSGCEAPEM
jgi:hypothetical protein